MKRPDEIDSFEKYVEREEVRTENSDPSEARSLLKRSKSKFETMERLGIDDSSATDYLENVYSAARMLIQSIMARKGYKPYSHEAVIAYAIDKLEIDMVNANSLNRYRKLRNDIEYRGEVVSQKEAESIRRLYRELREEIQSESEQ